jgi:3-oxoacyl-[acyl-carrier-protein] synthase-3
LTDEPVFAIGKGAYFTDGSNYDNLIKKPDKALYMNGRGIFNFVMRHVPPTISRCLAANEVGLCDIDLYLLHQGSKYVVENVVNRMKLDPAKAPIDIREYGNTVSSTIPILLQPHIDSEGANTILACGFGVGLSIAATIIRRA